MENKIKIGFEIGGYLPSGDEGNIWENKGDYRQVLRELSLNGDNDMFIVTKNCDTTYVNNVATYLGIKQENIFMCADNATILSLLDQHQISIYLSNDEELIISGNTDTNKLATILVNFIPDPNKLQGKYASLLQFWLRRRLEDRKS